MEAKAGKDGGQDRSRPDVHSGSKAAAMIKVNAANTECSVTLDKTKVDAAVRLGSQVGPIFLFLSF